ncbi:MAG: septum formation protein Maf [Clostridia bacterium]|nr:septum formation protein Maf [Clostridia bacterium]
MEIILASGSPRRKELLKLITSKFEIIVSGVEENLEEGLTPQEQVKRLAYIKAKDIYEKTNGNRIIIGADTIVTKDNKIYGKPKDKVQAKQMIEELINGDKTHSVITGICILIEDNGEYKEYNTYDEVKVFFKDISNKEIEKWIDTGKALDKAGAYSIQDEFGVFIDRIEGNYTTIVGLPINKVYDIIKEYI